MQGQPAEVLDWAGSAGHVRIAGERWNAVGPSDLVPGETVRVERLDGLTLTVRRAALPASLPGSGPDSGPASTPAASADATAGRERWSR
jgi:hypothetical protein